MTRAVCPGAAGCPYTVHNPPQPCKMNQQEKHSTLSLSSGHGWSMSGGWKNSKKQNPVTRTHLPWLFSLSILYRWANQFISMMRCQKHNPLWEKIHVVSQADNSDCNADLFSSHRHSLLYLFSLRGGGGEHWHKISMLWINPCLHFNTETFQIACNCWAS